MFAGRLTPAWSRFFYRVPEPVPPGLSAALRPNRLQATAAPRPAPRPAATRPPLRLGWRPWELAVLVSKLPPAYRAEALDGLRCTLEFRAHSEEPPKRPKDAPLDEVGRSRFSLLGERLQGDTPDDLFTKLRTELRESTWTLETVSLRLVRNYYLNAQHPAGPAGLGTGAAAAA